MSLKNKLIFILISAGLVLALSFLLSFNLFMLPSLEKNKAVFIENLQKKLKTALSIEENTITLLCDEWANRECMSVYIEKKIEEIVADAFPDSLFFRDHLDLLLVLDIHKNLLFYKGFFQDRRPIEYKGLELEQEIHRITRIIGRVHQRVKSIVQTPFGPFMIVANPIWDRSMQKPGGVLLVGQFFDNQMAQRFTRYTMEDIRLLELAPTLLKDFVRERMQCNEFYYEDERDTLSTYLMLKDIDAKPAVILYNRTDNKLFRVVNRHTISFVAISIVLAATLGLLLYFYIDRLMIKRMRTITGTMKKIGGLEDLSVRVDKDGFSDEISHLVSNLNVTLDNLENEKNQREKVERNMLTHSKLVSLGRLSSNIAHEINNPLLAISNSIQIIKKSVKRKSQLVSEAINISESEIDRIRKIISGLLDFHRLDQEEFCILDIKETLEQSLEILKWSKKLGDTRIKEHLADDCFVYGSPVKLKQVFVNFILNAVEAMAGQGGELKIELRHGRGKQEIVEVHFKDRGPGIPVEIREYLFEPFASTKENSGVGLGLFISFEIISNHHGEIIYNENYQEGTHFIIKLPASRR